MSYNTYSFQDVVVSLNYEGGIASSTGAGVGSITIAMDGDKTVHDVSADGGVMITKMAGKNGSIALQVQQVSAINKFLHAWYSAIETGPTSEWAKMSVIVESKNLGEKTTCLGVSPQKKADMVYQAQGQQVTWNLMAAEITKG